MEQVTPDGGGDTSEAETPQKVHPSVLPDPPEPIEPQLLFLHAEAIFLVEERIFRLEGILQENLGRRRGEAPSGSVLYPSPERALRRGLDRKSRWATQ